MTTTYTVQTEPGGRVPASGTLPALRTIVLHRNGPPLPPTPEPAPASAPAPRSSIPATAREVVARLATGPSLLKRPVAWVSNGPAPEAITCLALRQQSGLSQRDAASAAGVSRSLVAELERPTRRRHPAGSPTAERYLTWVRRYVAQLTAKGVQA